MSRCKKSPNACKICLQTVKPKQGLQCQGACESWVHYSCLNYTPGKIKDIQSGVITVTCPCPDCKTTVPKEIRSDAPYSCNNYKCPANMAPACDNHSCQANEITESRQHPPHPPGALRTCGVGCKNFKQPVEFPSLAEDPCMEGFIVSGRMTAGDMERHKMHLAMEGTNLATGGGGGMLNMAAVEKMCHTVGELTNQLNALMTTMKHAAQNSVPQQGQGGQQPCTQPGPRALCPKPCNCPGNPNQR